jgi:hypothetical protein
LLCNLRTLYARCSKNEKFTIHFLSHIYLIILLFFCLNIQSYTDTHLNRPVCKTVAKSDYKHCHVHLMCIGPCIALINEEEKSSRCNFVYYYTCERHNIFQAALCPSSGAHDFIYCSRSSLQPGHLASQTETNHQTISNLRIRRSMW